MVIERSYVHDGARYVIRDVWDDGTHVYKRGLRLLRCEYAVSEGGQTKWKPTHEGCAFADIEPLERLCQPA